MSSHVIMKAGEYGPRAILTGPCSRATLASLERRSIVELELNHAFGWRGDDIRFVASLPQLQVFDILDFLIEDIDPIHELRNLRSLGVSTYCKSEIRFSAFPLLEHCGIEWRAKAKSVFDCISLKHLFLNRYSGKNASDIGRLTRLESLEVLNAPVADLSGLSSLPVLKSLRIANLRCLESLDGLGEIGSLEELTIDTCRKVQSIAELARLLKLRTLVLNNLGEIESIRPIAGLRELRDVRFVESTNIVDGDLTPLAGLPRLKELSFKNRRHYSHRREQFEAYNHVEADDTLR